MSRMKSRIHWDFPVTVAVL